jgi:hypothetical protein
MDIFKKDSNQAVICKSVQTVAKNSGTLWAAVAMMAENDFHGRSLDVDTLKACFKSFEENAAKELKWSLTADPRGQTYRGCKSVAKNAIEKDIPLLTTDGKVRGKSEVEKDLKGLKEKETPAETVKRCSALIQKKIKEMGESADTTHQEACIAYALIEENLKLIGQLVNMKMPKAA